MQVSISFIYLFIYRKLSSIGLQNIPSSVVHVLMGFPLHLPWEATVPLNFSDMKFLPNTVTKLTLMNYRMVYTDSLCLPQGMVDHILDADRTRSGVCSFFSML